MPTREARTATPDDVDRLVAVHTAAFPDGRSVPQRVRNFTSNPFGTLDDLHVVLEDGRIVGHGFLFRLGVFYGGRVVPTGGIASIGVAPESRGRGVASFLIDRLHAASLERGDALALLYAYRYGFYERLGYARAATSKRLLLAPSSIPPSWTQAARSALLRTANGSDLGRLRSLYRAAATTGCLDRPDGLWHHLLLDERIHTLVLGNAGYVSFEHLQAEPHAETQLNVRDLVAKDAGTRRTLLGVLGLQGDQCSQIVLEVAADDPLDLVLGDIDARRFGTVSVEHTFGDVVGGPMVRILDVPRALTARGWPTQGVVDIAVDGVPYRITAGEKVEPSLLPTLTMSRSGLAAVAFGSLRATRAHELGVIDGDPVAVASADAILGLPPFFSRDPF